ncbi:hypothetical protein GCM10027414_23720 [Humibacter ginsengiterrae]
MEWAECVAKLARIRIVEVDLIGDAVESEKDGLSLSVFDFHAIDIVDQNHCGFLRHAITIRNCIAAAIARRVNRPFANAPAAHYLESDAETEVGAVPP